MDEARCSPLFSRTPVYPVETNTLVFFSARTDNVYYLSPITTLFHVSESIELESCVASEINQDRATLAELIHILNMYVIRSYGMAIYNLLTPNKEKDMYCDAALHKYYGYGGTELKHDNKCSVSALKPKLGFIFDNNQSSVSALAGITAIPNMQHMSGREFIDLCTQERISISSDTVEDIVRQFVLLRRNMLSKWAATPIEGTRIHAILESIYERGSCLETAKPIRDRVSKADYDRAMYDLVQRTYISGCELQEDQLSFVKWLTEGCGLTNRDFDGLLQLDLPGIHARANKAFLKNFLGMKGMVKNNCFLTLENDVPEYRSFYGDLLISKSYFRVLRGELAVCLSSAAAMVTGTIDAIADLDMRITSKGELSSVGEIHIQGTYIVDFKTSDPVSPSHFKQSFHSRGRFMSMDNKNSYPRCKETEYFIQVAMYKYILQHTYGISYDAIIIVVSRDPMSSNSKQRYNIIIVPPTIVADVYKYMDLYMRTGAFS